MTDEHAGLIFFFTLMFGIVIFLNGVILFDIPTFIIGSVLLFTSYLSSKKGLVHEGDAA